MLGTQVQAREASNPLECQQQFLTLVNDPIANLQSLDDFSSNFEDALSKVRGVVNYVIAEELYTVPSDIKLNKLKQCIQRFNDDIKVAAALIKLPSPKSTSKLDPTTLKPLVNFNPTQTNLETCTNTKPNTKIFNTNLETCTYTKANSKKYITLIPTLTFKLTKPDIHESTKGIGALRVLYSMMTSILYQRV